MFRRLPDPAAATVTVSVDGRLVAARAGDTVAAALLAAGVLACRDAVVDGAPRAPYCLMGVCFECLVAIDGQQGCQACLVRVRDGMRIATRSRP
jgi:predicted molibdopterin-dependent oxidoreductase YjgC